MIQDKDGTPVHAQRLLFGGKQLEDERTITDYHVRRQHTLILVGSIRGAGRHRTPPFESGEQLPRIPADPTQWESPPDHFGLNTICGVLQMSYTVKHLKTERERPPHQGGISVGWDTTLECHPIAGSPYSCGHSSGDDAVIFGTGPPDELEQHPQIVRVVQALKAGGVHSSSTRVPGAGLTQTTPTDLHAFSISDLVHAKWADRYAYTASTGQPFALPGFHSVTASSCLHYAVEEDDVPLRHSGIIPELDSICTAITTAIVTSTILERLLLLPALQPNHAHARLPFPDHPRKLLGLDCVGESFRRVLLIPPTGPESWLNRLCGLADAFRITFEYAAIGHARTTVSFGCKTSLLYLEQDAVRPLLLSDFDEYMTGSNSHIMMPRGGWCLEGYGPTYRARLDHAAFRIYCLVLEALSDDASLLGGIMRRCHPWRCPTDQSGSWASRPLDPYRPCFHGGLIDKFGRIEPTDDPTKIDLWIRHHVRQHLVVDCRMPDASEETKWEPSSSFRFNRMCSSLPTCSVPCNRPYSSLSSIRQSWPKSRPTQLLFNKRLRQYWLLLATGEHIGST